MIIKGRKLRDYEKAMGVGTQISRGDVDDINPVAFGDPQNMQPDFKCWYLFCKAVRECGENRVDFCTRLQLRVQTVHDWTHGFARVPKRTGEIIARKLTVKPADIFHRWPKFCADDPDWAKPILDAGYTPGEFGRLINNSVGTLEGFFKGVSCVARPKGEYIARLLNVQADDLFPHLRKPEKTESVRVEGAPQSDGSSVAYRIECRLAKLGWTWQQFQMRGEFAPGTIVGLKRGTLDPRVSTANRVCAVLGCTLDDLFGPESPESGAPE